MTRPPGSASKRSVRLGIHDDRQEAVLQRIGSEDVGDRGRDHRAEAVIEQSPRRVFARRAAGEIVAGDEDAVLGGIERVERCLGIGSPSES